MTVRGELTIAHLCSLLTDYGRFGPLTGPEFELLGSKQSHLGAATHYRRRVQHALAAKHACIALASSQPTPATYWVCGLILGSGVEPQLELAREALEALAASDPTAVEATIVDAIQSVDLDPPRCSELLAKLRTRGGVDGSVLDGIEALRLTSAGDFAGAAALLMPHRELLALTRDAAHIGRDWRARFAELTGEYARTVGLLSPWFSAAPTVALAVRLAVAQTAGGHCYDAVSTLESVTPDENNLAYFSARARARRFAGRLPESSQDYDSALSAKSIEGVAAREHAQCLIDKAELDSQQSRFVAAIASLDRAAELTAKNALIYVMRARMKQAVLRYAEAASDWTRALELEPLDCPGDTVGQIATSLFNARRYEAAAEQYERAALILTSDESYRQVNEAIASYWEHRGVCFHFLSKLELAVQCYTEALRHFPTFGKAFSDRGEALLALDRPAAALIDLDRAIELGYKIGCTMLAKGQCFQRENKHTLALAALDEAVTSWPTSPLPLEARAISREALANHAGARDDRERAAVLRATKRS